MCCQLGVNGKILSPRRELILRNFLIFYLDNHLASCWSYTVIAIAIKSSRGNFSFAQTVLTSCRAIATTREHSADSEF